MLPADRGSRRGSPTVGRTLLLYGKPGCCLCDAARPIAERLARQYGIALRHRSILDDVEAYQRYRDRIPVLLLDGEVLDEGNVSVESLRRALRGRLPSTPRRRLPWSS